MAREGFVPMFRKRPATTREGWPVRAADAAGRDGSVSTAALRSGFGLNVPCGLLAGTLRTPRHSPGPDLSAKADIA